jgi:hypothetical protein
MHNEIIARLNSLDSIGLENIDSVKFMNRTDTKFVFPIHKLVDLIDRVKGNYKVLEINNERSFQYQTTYLDSPDFLFFNQHARGELERIKIRFRKYHTTDTTFLEIKKKSNIRRTIKIRIENNLIPGFLDDVAINFIRDNSPVDPMLIKPVLVNRFFRATLVGLETKERITLDYNLSFSDPGDELKVEMPFLAIAELKKEGQSSLSPFNHIIRNMGIYPMSFSKYSIGLASLNDSLKKNRTKSKFLLLNKIENEYIKYNLNQ